MESSEIISSLNSFSSVKIIKAAKKLRKLPFKGACTHLLEAYKRESNSNSWETQAEIIVTSGILLCNDFIPYLETICQKNEPHSAVTTVAGCSYLRIKRNSLTDVTPILKYIGNINYSLGKGFLFALGLDKMIPNDNDQKILISEFHDFGKDRNPLYSDPRYGLAAACAGWTNSKVDDFLHHCIKTGDRYLINVAESALKGEYVKKHIYGIY